MAADVRAAWARLRLPQPVVKVEVAWSRLVIPAAPAGALTITDRPKAVLAGSRTRDTLTNVLVVDLGAPQHSLSGTARQSTGFVGTALSITDRPLGVRAGRPTQTATLATIGAPPASATMPAFAVEIDADPNTTGLFVLGTSTLAGGTVLAADHRWVAVNEADLRTIGIRRGRSREDQAVDVGTASIVLDGWSGNYDPDNPATPYKLAGTVLLRTGVGVRVKVTLAGAAVYLFTGTLESTAADHGREPSVTWTCVDAMARLGQAAVAPITLGRANEVTSDRVAWLLDQAGVAEADRLISPAGRTLLATEGGGTVLSNLEAVVDAEQGQIYVDRLNRIVLESRADQSAKLPTLAFSDVITAALADTYVDTYGDVYGGLQDLEYDSVTIEPGAAQVINNAVVKQTVKSITLADDGTASVTSTDFTYTGTDPASVERFGKRSSGGDAGVETQRADPVEAQALADYLATRRATPASRASQVTTSLVGLDVGALTQAAELDLGDRLTLRRTTADGRTLSFALVAEGIDHAISTTGWTLDLSTSPTAPVLIYGSAFQLGVTWTQDTLVGTPTAVARARDNTLVATGQWQAHSLMGWGKPNPEPSPGVYDWSVLDAHLAITAATGGQPVITLCGAPDWMKGGTAGTTDWSQLEVAPLPGNYADFAALAVAVATRYPQVRYFNVWNELKGFWNFTLNRWNYEAYTTFYNTVYDALKAHDPTLNVGGPYVSIGAGAGSHPSSITGCWGTVDQRGLDVIPYWLANKHGADYLVIDGHTDPAAGVPGCDAIAANGMYTAVTEWVTARTSLPVWWSELYPQVENDATTPPGDQYRADVFVDAVDRIRAAGGFAAFLWGPEESTTLQSAALWSSTLTVGGGQPLPLAAMFSTRLRAR